MRMDVMSRACLAAACLGLVAMPAGANEGPAPPPPAEQQPIESWAPLGPVYDLAVRAAKNGQYEQAIKLLEALKRDDHPQVLNYLGYAHRKLGKVQEAVPFYEKALSIAPDYTAAREYLGEAWLQLGEPIKAREELAEIEKHCGTECDDYVSLRDAIEAYVSNSSAAGGRRDAW
jgi:tetratricopeptide (TPR) repeat protein